MLACAWPLVCLTVPQQLPLQIFPEVTKYQDHYKIDEKWSRPRDPETPSLQGGKNIFSFNGMNDGCHVKKKIFLMFIYF